MSNPAKPEEQPAKADPATEKSTCGIIMPISSIGTYTADHWVRVKTILERAIEAAGYEPRIVSESSEVGIIHSHIVQNIYDDEIIVCDVSGKNPNVMFELGLRLAFDKPVIVVKDDETDYSFDTSPIKHIGYRKDLRFDDAEAFQRKVTLAISATVQKAKDDNDFSPFLKHFGSLTPKKVEGKEIGESEFILAKLSEIETQIKKASQTVVVVPQSKYWDTGIQTKHLTAFDSFSNRLKGYNGVLANSTEKNKLEIIRELFKNELKDQGIDISANEFDVLLGDFLQSVASKVATKADSDTHKG